MRFVLVWIWNGIRGMWGTGHAWCSGHHGASVESVLWGYTFVIRYQCQRNGMIASERLVYDEWMGG